MRRSLPQRLRRERDDRGYVAIVVAITMTVMLVMAAFTVDVGNWYFTASREQKAADAAALAGVPNLPGDKTTAFSDAKRLAKINGFSDGADTVTVTPAIADQPTRLKVTVTKTVQNYFGGLIGHPTTTITRSAVADFVGPLPMGSPCNAFGSDPVPGATRSASCANTADFWANVGSYASEKVNGDPYQSGSCRTAADLCSSTNSEYDSAGYYYVVTLRQAVANLQFEAFDPVWVEVGNLCTNVNLTGAAGTIYERGATSKYCTGDSRYDVSSAYTKMKTEFTVRASGPDTTYWDPPTYPAVTGCTKVYGGYALDGAPSSLPTAARNAFRKWVNLCTISYAPAGQYMIQVRTNAQGTDAANAHNRFGLRVYSSTDSTAKDSIAVSGFSRMAIYANVPSGKTRFHLTRVPTQAAGQVLNVRLFDIGDVSSGSSGTVTVLKPDNTPPDTCTGSGVRTGNLTSCSITASSSYNGRWQTISVSIPLGYSCTDSDPNACWWRLQYDYTGSQPSDATAWTAGLAANPVRLIQ